MYIYYIILYIIYFYIEYEEKRCKVALEIAFCHYFSMVNSMNVGNSKAGVKQGLTIHDLPFSLASNRIKSRV